MYSALLNNNVHVSKVMTKEAAIFHVLLTSGTADNLFLYHWLLGINKQKPIYFD